MNLLKKCLELLKIREKVIPIFLLINEREKRVNRDIKVFLNLTELNEIQKRYLQSLVQTLKEVTNKIVSRISQFKKDHPSIGKQFLIDGTVLDLISLGLCK